MVPQGHDADAYPCRGKGVEIIVIERDSTKTALITWAACNNTAEGSARKAATPARTNERRMGMYVFSPAAAMDEPKGSNAVVSTVQYWTQKLLISNPGRNQIENILRGQFGETREISLINLGQQLIKYPI